MYFYGIANHGFLNAVPSTQPLEPANAQPTATPNPRESVLTRCKASCHSKMQPSSGTAESASRTRRIINWMHRLHPRRWLRRRIAYTPCNTTPPVLPPINISDRLFLESLIRHTEDAVFQSRASTQPLLCRESQPPPSEFQFDGSSTPYQQSSSFDCAVGASELVGMPIIGEQAFNPNENAREETPLRRNNFLLLRTPHPPTSYPLSPPNLSHSRRTSQSKSSIITSSCDHTAYRISSVSLSSVSDRSSPLFYRSARSPTPESRVTSLSPITPTKSNSLPVYPIARAGSLTISIRTEKGREDLEFPSPPTRWSGCWFAERANNQTPRQYKQEEEAESVEEDGMETPALTTAQQSQLSLQTSTGSSSISPLPTTPNVRTFGFGTTSFLSLNAKTSTRAEGRARLAAKPSEDDFGDADDEEMESVCSRFADVSLTSGATFDGVDDPLSDTDSYADPSLMRL